MRTGDRFSPFPRLRGYSNAAAAQRLLADKVSICHRPPGNPEKFHTISVSANAVPKLLARGDERGECDTICELMCPSYEVPNCEHIATCEGGCSTITTDINDCDDGTACTNDFCDIQDGMCKYLDNCQGTNENCDFVSNSCKVDPCFDSPCANGGTCSPDGTDGFTCQCADGWTGETCTEPSCYTCSVNNPCTSDTADEYFTHCDPTYFVQCDAFGGCFEMPCALGAEWNQAALTCIPV